MHGARVTCVTASNRMLTHGSGSHNARYVPTSAFPSTHKDTGPTYLQIFSFVRTLPDWLCEISTYTFVRSFDSHYEAQTRCGIDTRASHRTEHEPPLTSVQNALTWMQPRKHESEAPTVSASRVGDAFRSSSGRFGEPRVPSASATPPLDTLHKRRILPFSMYIRSRHIRYVRRVSSDVYLDSALLSFFLYPISTLSPFSFLLSPTTVTPFCRSSRER